MKGNPDAKEFLAKRLAPALIHPGDSVVMFNFDAQAYGTGPDSRNLVFIESARPDQVGTEARGAPWPLSSAQGTARKWAVVQAMDSLDRVRKLGAAYAGRPDVIVGVTDTDVDNVTPETPLAAYQRALSGGVLQFVGEVRDSRPKSRLTLMFWGYAPAGAARLTPGQQEDLLGLGRKCLPPGGPSGAAPEEDLIEGSIVSPGEFKSQPRGTYPIEFELSSGYDSAIFAGGAAAEVEAAKWDTGAAASAGAASLSPLRIEDAESGGEVVLEAMHTGDTGELERDTVRLSADLQVNARPAWWDPRSHMLDLTLSLRPEDAYLFAAPVAGPSRVEKARLFGIQTRPYTAELLTGTVRLAYPFNWRPLAYFGLPLIALIVLGLVCGKSLRRRPMPLYFHVVGSEEPWAQRNVLPKAPLRVGSQFATPGKDVVEVEYTKQGLTARPVGDAVLLNESGGETGGSLVLGEGGSFQVETTVVDVQGNEKRTTVVFEHSREPVFGGPDTQFAETFEDTTTGETFDF
jgi:hypothetical protein